MTLFLILGLVLLVAVALRPIGVVGNPNMAGDLFADTEKQSCFNHSATATIPHGALVAKDLAVTDSNALNQIIKRTNGAAAPASANVHQLWGILEAPDQVALARKSAGNVVVGGLCRARVRVPAGLNLSAGTFLIPGTVEDAANDTVSWQTYLEPLVYDGAAQVPGNAFAVLMEDLTAGGSDTTVLAWVSVYPHHRPLPFGANWNLMDPVNVAGAWGSQADAQRNLLMAPRGPGVVTRVAAQLTDQGSAGNTEIRVRICPLAGTADEREVLSTQILLVNDGNDGYIAGVHCRNDGDNDTFTNNGYGTGGSKGVLNTLAKRQFSGRSILTGFFDVSSGTAQNGLNVVVEGLLY